MQRPDDFGIHRVGAGIGILLIHPVLHALQVPARVVVKHRAHRSSVTDRSLGQLMRSGNQLRCRIRRLALFTETVDQLGQQRDSASDQVQHFTVDLHFAVTTSIQQILAGPSVVADEIGADHAATTLERVKGSPHFQQVGHVTRFALPRRKLTTQGFEHFARFFDEDLANLGVDLIEQLRRN